MFSDGYETVGRDPFVTIAYTQSALNGTLRLKRSLVDLCSVNGNPWCLRPQPGRQKGALQGAGAPAGWGRGRRARAHLGAETLPGSSAEGGKDAATPRFCAHTGPGRFPTPDVS